MVTSGSRGWADYYSDVGPLFLRIGNISVSSVDLKLTDVQRVQPPEGAEGYRTRVETGDVLVSITALLGAVGVSTSGVGRGVRKSTCSAGKTDPNDVSAQMDRILFAFTDGEATMPGFDQWRNQGRTWIG